MMDTLQKAFDKQISDVPRAALAEVLDEKLRAHGLVVSKRKRLALADQILEQEIDALTFDHDSKGRSRKISIEFDDADVARMEERFAKFMDDLPSIIAAMSERISRGLLRSLIKKWKGESRAQQRQIEGFRKRLRRRWKGGLGRLRMLLAIAKEYGSDFQNYLNSVPSVESPKTFEIMVKLHARACQVADEILWLLEGGFADGAIARWRTLHEIAAVAYLIQRNGDELAERYEQHQVIESRKAARQYAQHHARLGQEPMAKEAIDSIEAEHAALLAKYGPEFGSQQGWAAKLLNKRNPTIADIQEAVGIDHFGPYYRMASHNVHANPKGVFFKLGLMSETGILLSGPSNAGLTEPGHATALSLVQISSALLQLHPTIDNQVIVQVMCALEEEIGGAFLAADRKLQADHSQFQRSAGPESTC